MELDALNQVYDEIGALGADLVGISPQKVEYNREMKEKHNLRYDLLSDNGSEVAKRFGLVYALPDDLKKVYLSFGIDLPKYNGDDSWTLPMPARYVIDSSVRIVAAQVEADYTTRPEPDGTIANLRKLLAA